MKTCCYNLAKYNNRQFHHSWSEGEDSCRHEHLIRKANKEMNKSDRVFGPNIS